MVWVNAMWMISLVLSITSALMATLLQQWARRYVETPKVPSEPNDRARVRWFLFDGTEVYHMRLLVEIAPTLLHLSVYLFFAGLVITFHTIHPKVAIAVDVSVGVFGVAYIMLSILPCLDVRCPYRTPMSYLWFPFHIFLSFTAYCLYWSGTGLHGCLVNSTPSGRISSNWQQKLVNWLDSCGNFRKKHWRYLMDGFEKSVINGAKSAQEGDHKIITALFSVLSLNNKSKLRKLAASIPRPRIADLIRPIESGNFVLRDPLLFLLRSCEAGTHATGPDEDARKRSLVVCLGAICHISETLDFRELNFVRANFAKMGLMRKLWDDSDTAVRVTSHSICALIARRVCGRDQLEGEELRWLEDVLGETSNEIFNANVATRDRMNFKSFVYGVLSNQVDDLPTEDVTSFRETLAILLDARTDPHFDMPSSQNQLSEGVRRIHQDDPEGSREVVNRLLSMFSFIPPPFPVPIT
ncbi:hypothetical protein F5888DRAFT_503649 [Russula emetica]|nr:hypothetical protein F5888DRAFT_503649 [Russula emetica]